MQTALAHLMALLVHQPDRLGWLARHAWHWHKVPIAEWFCWSVAALWALRELGRASWRLAATAIRFAFFFGVALACVAGALIFTVWKG